MDLFIWSFMKSSKTDIMQQKSVIIFNKCDIIKLFIFYVIQARLL